MDGELSTSGSVVDEIEALRAVYFEEILEQSHEGSGAEHYVRVLLRPLTADDERKQFVQADLLLTTDSRVRMHCLVCA